MSTSQPAARPDAAAHYDAVTEAWQYLLGANLHYGYFETMDMPLDSATDALTRLLVRSAKLSPGMSVLDVGCGSGNPALYLALQHECRVMGISTSAACVDSARARASGANLTGRLQFEVRDGMATGLPSESFDRVWVMESSHLMPRKDLLLEECARVLRPGGRLALCDVMLLRPVSFTEVLTLRRQIQVLDNVFGRGVMSELSEYAQLARNAGLKVVVELDISRQTKATFDWWRENAKLHRAVVAELLGEDGLRQFLQACDLLDRFWLDWLGYGVLAAEKPIA